MGWYVHLSVSFACDTNEGVAKLAAEHLMTLGEGHPGEREARWFLAALSERSGSNPGPKGGLSTWGMIGNHTDVPAFVEVLGPFWCDLLGSAVDGGPLDFEHVIVFEEQEQSHRAHAFEISWDADSAVLSVEQHVCPFAWNQY